MYYGAFIFAKERVLPVLYTHDEDTLELFDAQCILQDAHALPFLPDAAAKLLLQRHGSAVFGRDTIFLEGAGGATRMYNVLRLLCHDIPTHMGSCPVQTLRDYQSGIGFDLGKRKAFRLSPMQQQAVALDAQDGSIVILADEEKTCLHIYTFAQHPSPTHAHRTLEQMRLFVRNWMMQHV